MTLHYTGRLIGEARRGSNLGKPVFFTNMLSLSSLCLYVCVERHQFFVACPVQEFQTVRKFGGKGSQVQAFITPIVI